MAMMDFDVSLSWLYACNLIKENSKLVLCVEESPAFLGWLYIEAMQSFSSPLGSQIGAPYPKGLISAIKRSTLIFFL